MNELTPEDYKNLLSIINSISVKGSEVEYIAQLKQKLEEAANG